MDPGTRDMRGPLGTLPDGMPSGAGVANGLAIQPKKVLVVVSTWPPKIGTPLLLAIVSKVAGHVRRTELDLNLHVLRNGYERAKHLVDQRLAGVVEIVDVGV